MTYNNLKYNRTSDNSCKKSCSLFDFMANTMGIKVLHPGGYVATEKLSSLCQLNESSHVLDVACGTGTTSMYLSRKYQCRVTGIDRAENLIKIAREKLKNTKLRKISFDIGDALLLPYADNT